MSKFLTAPLDKELICEIASEDEKNTLLGNGVSSHSDVNNLCDDNKPSRDVIIINVSPIEFGHCLLVPSLEETLPQILTESSIRYQHHRLRFVFTVSYINRSFIILY